MDMSDVQLSRPDVPAKMESEIAVSEPLQRELGQSRLPTTLARSLAAVLVGSLILRLAAQTMGQMTQFYLDHISRSSFYHISHTTRGYVLASFFVTELLGSLFLGAMSD